MVMLAGLQPTRALQAYLGQKNIQMGLVWGGAACYNDHRVRGDFSTVGFYGSVATKKINSAKAWTTDEEERLRPTFDIAADLGRTVSAVQARAQALHLVRQFAIQDQGEGEVAAFGTEVLDPEKDDRLWMLVEAGEPIEFRRRRFRRAAAAGQHADRSYSGRQSVSRCKRESC
jgi:hypothetical protein